MTFTICDDCQRLGETDDDDGGQWDGGRYYCACCVKAQIAAEDAPGDAFEEAKIREHELAGRPMKPGS